MTLFQHDWAIFFRDSIATLPCPKQSILVAICVFYIKKISMYETRLPPSIHCYDHFFVFFAFYYSILEVPDKLQNRAILDNSDAIFSLFYCWNASFYKLILYSRWKWLIIRIITCFNISIWTEFWIHSKNNHHSIEYMNFVKRNITP